MKFAILGFFAVALCALLIPTAVDAAVPTVAPGAKDVVPLAPVAEVLFDPEGALTLESVAAVHDDAFRSLPGAFASVGQSTGALWGRVRLDLTDVAAADQWLLALDTLLLARADLFLVSDDGDVLLHEVRGMAVGGLSPGGIQYTVALTPFAGRAITLYVRVQSRFALVMAPILRTTLAQMRHETDMIRMHAPIIGAMAGTLLIFAAHWLMLRLRLYGYALGAALGVLITGLFGSGLNRAYDITWTNNIDWWILEGGGIIGLYCIPMFIATYLALNDRRPGAYRLLRWGAAVMTAANLVLMLFLPHRLITGLTASFFVVAAVSLWLMVIQPGVGKRDRWSLVLAMGPFLVLGCLHMVAFNRWAPDLLPWRGWVKELFTIGLATLLIGFALAVADQIRFRLGELAEQRTRQLRKSQAETEEALIAEQVARQRLRQFITMAAHEFKTPLAVIDSGAQVLPLLLGPIAADAQRRLDNIRANVVRLLRLIDSCFAEDRLDEAGLVLRMGPFDPVALIEEVAQYHRLYLSRAIQLRVEAPPSSIEGDPELLRMVFNALLDNAAKYSPKDTVIDVEINSSADRLLVHVLDRGCGVPPQDRAELFTRYFRASNVTAVPGTGLGLYLARSIVTRHAGTLALADRDGGGTVFTVSLPIHGQGAAA